MEIVIYGAGQLGRFVLDVLNQIPGKSVIGFVDDDKSLHGRRVDKVEVLGDITCLSTLIDNGLKYVVVAVGDIHKRAYIVKKMLTMGLEPVNVIHPTAIYCSQNLGEGNIIMGGTFIAYNAKIGDNNYIAPGTVITHDAVIGSCVTLGTSACIGASLTIEDCVLIGQNATIMTGVKKVGKNSIVGAGAVVIKDVPANVTVVGVPARVIDKR